MPTHSSIAGPVWEKNRHLFYNFQSVIHFFLCRPSVCSVLPEKSNLYSNSFLSDGLGVAQKPQFGRAVVTYGACEWTEEKWIMLQEKLESACMDNLLLSSPPDCVKASRSGLPFLKYRMQRLSNEKKGTWRLLDPMGDRDSKAWRCDVNLTKKQKKTKLQRPFRGISK